MKPRLVVSGLAAAALLCAASGTARAAAADEVLRDVLRQQSAAERSVCPAVKRAIAGGTDPLLVARTAVELGYNPCQVIRCAVETRADLAKILQGAASGGTSVDVLSRCAVEAGADPAAVAAVIGGLELEPDFCYFTFGPVRAPAALPPVLARDTPSPQYSRFSF
jgi:hypothetical protein